MPAYSSRRSGSGAVVDEVASAVVVKAKLERRGEAELDPAGNRLGESYSGGILTPLPSESAISSTIGRNDSHGSRGFVIPESLTDPRVLRVRISGRGLDGPR